MGKGERHRDILMKLSAILRLALLVLLHTFSLCEADDYSDELIENANQGDIGAQRKLGFMYSAGHRVPRNYSEAMKWFKRPLMWGMPMPSSTLG
jgi:hypothetical protein